MGGGGKGLDGGGREVERLEGSEAMAAGAVDDVVVARFWKVYVGLDVVATREAEFGSNSVSSEKSK